jgi:hypothetical protein
VKAQADTASQLAQELATAKQEAAGATAALEQLAAEHRSVGYWQDEVERWRLLFKVIAALLIADPRFGVMILSVSTYLVVLTCHIHATGQTQGWTQIHVFCRETKHTRVSQLSIFPSLTACRKPQA